LLVTDPSGASDTAQVGINVVAASPTLHVGDIAMALTVKRSSAQANATVSVLDANGKAIVGATVTGTWSGVVSGSSSGVTGTGGTVKLSSPSTKKTSGTFTFTITGVAFSGYAYKSSDNMETSDSITR
jgi:subtilisin